MTSETDGAALTSPQPAGLDVVLALAAQLWPDEVTQRWLVGNEPFLNGARPIDVLRTNGPEQLLAALDAAASGSYSRTGLTTSGPT